MKTRASQLLTAASMVLAVVFGFPLFRALRLLVKTVPGEHTFIVMSPVGFVHSLLVSLSPLALYAAGFVLDRRVGWSRFGKLALAVQVVYGLFLTGSSIYLYRFVHSLDHTAW